MKQKVELEYKPRSKCWRVFVGGKSLTRRFYKYTDALKEFNKQRKQNT